MCPPPSEPRPEYRDSISAAKDGLRVDLVGESGTRTPVVHVRRNLAPMIGVLEEPRRLSGWGSLELCPPAATAHPDRRWIQSVVPFSSGNVHVPTQAEIHRQLPANLPVVLREYANVGAGGGCGEAVAEGASAVVRQTEQEARKRETLRLSVWSG